MMVYEEFHVTVKGDAVRWPIYCANIGIKPLWIELNNFERQLMCATNKDPRVEWAGRTMLEYFERGGFQILRVKHERQVPRNRVWEFLPASVPMSLDLENPPRPVSTKVITPVYYECHVKLNGLFRPDFYMASRDLYREERWYVTRRQATPFDPETFRATVQSVLDASHWPAQIRSIEYEACLSDSHPELDAHWLKNQWLLLLTASKSW